MKEEETIMDNVNAKSADKDVMNSPSSSNVCVKSLATGISLHKSPSSVTLASSDSLSSSEASNNAVNDSLEESVVEEKKEHDISFTDEMSNDKVDDKVIIPVLPVQVVPLDQILNPSISFANEMDDDDDEDYDGIPLSPSLSSSSDNDSSLDAEEEASKATSFDTTDESNMGDVLKVVSSSPTGSTTEEEEEEEEDTRNNNNNNNINNDNNIAHLDVTQVNIGTQFVPSQEVVKQLQEEDPIPIAVQEGTLIDLTEQQEQQPSSSNKNNNKIYDLPPVFPAWTRVTEALQRYLRRFLISLALVSARNPYRCIVSVIVISFGLLVAGLATNFHIEVDEIAIYAPFNSLPRIHQRWYNEESGLRANTRGTILMIHNKDDDNDNAGLSRDTMKRVFQALDTVRNTTGFQDIVCQDGAYWDEHAQQFTCRIMSATRFWYHDQSLFDDQVESDEDLIRQLSATEYPGGAPVDHSYIMGNYQRDDNGTITQAPAFFVLIFLTDKPETKAFELAMLQRLAQLRREWAQDPTIPLRLDYTSVRSPTDEFRRAIKNDMYLLPIVFIMMSGFTCLVYFKPHNLVQSRCLLGVGMVTTILMATFTGFGIMFIFGVPFTSMTQLLPFVLFGVGLDDAIIITGEYLRTDPALDTEERIQLALTEAGSSITVTTLTTVLAFSLGLTSSVPAIYWMCLYAFPTFLIDYLYQVSFFVAIIVLDERRIKANRLDIVICCKSSKNKNIDKYDATLHNFSSEQEESDNGLITEQSAQVADRIMAWYARQLLRPVSRFLVLFLFSLFFGFCISRTALMRQQFDVTTLFPTDSYAKDAIKTMRRFQERTITFSILFRHENQADPEVQKEMISFVEDIQALPAFGAPPPVCWVRDFQLLQKTDYYDVVKDMTFAEQLEFALEIPAFKEAYGSDIVLDYETGEITASRCTILARNSFVDTVASQIDFLKGQRALTEAQPINQGKAPGDESFFTYREVYLVWSFFSVAVNELISTTVLSVAAVTVITLVFIPHWTAVPFILPLMIVVYIDLLGVMQMAGLHINAITLVCLVISIGLFVDFLLHVLLRYTECKGVLREERVQETLETMGASVLLGGLSTFLGVLPLAFSTSTVMQTVFICLCAMVVLGLAHGLIVLPVILSFVGPICNISAEDRMHANVRQKFDEIAAQC